ncbi:MAG: hypothetical protein KA713_13335 [Chryseotalea sp. WA131a]|jgi:hypothetical protein|nr:MAG: hypothetical protein KA713_13335 [Chryseotalea sp. WA131a]
MKETLRTAGYMYLKYLGYHQHLLLNVDTNIKEVFISNKNHASWGLIYKNTHLEFASSLAAIR